MTTREFASRWGQLFCGCIFGWKAYHRCTKRIECRDCRGYRWTIGRGA